MNAKHLLLWDPAKGTEVGNTFSFIPLLPGLFLNLQELLKAKGMRNHPEKYKQGAGKVHAQREGTEKDYKEQGKEKFSLSVPITPFNAEGILEKD